MSQARDIDVALFDIGGVILQMGDIGSLGPFNGVSESAAIASIWLDSPIVRAHECGEIEANEFAARMVETYDIGCKPHEFLQRCIAWHGPLFPEVEETISEIASEVHVACLSNTCDFHWRNHSEAARVDRLFPTQFLSFRLGTMKPEPAIFRAAVEALGTEPERILFFDDTERHVLGARAFGFMSHCVNGMLEARLILERYGLLRAA